MPADGAVPGLEPDAVRPREPDPRVARSRALLLRAATQLLADGGIDAVTIDAVVATSGVARATLYRHFSSQVELLAAAFQQLVPRVAVPRENESVRDRLLALMSEQARVAQEAPLQVALLSWLGMNRQIDGSDHERGRPELRALRQRIIEHYAQPFSAILVDVGIHIEHGDASILAQLVGPLLFNLLITREPIDHSFCARIVDAFLAARQIDISDDSTNT